MVGKQLAQIITKLFNGVVFHGRIPSAWKRGLIVPIFKGNGKIKSAPDSYRPVSLLPSISKLFEKLLITRVNDFVDIGQFPSRQQNGFVKGFGCTTASFQLQETIYHNLELNSKVFVAFLDSSKAFDTVWRKGLSVKLHKLGIKDKLWTLIDDYHIDTQSAVVANSQQSKWFKQTQGVRQGGCIISIFVSSVHQ